MTNPRIARIKERLEDQKRDHGLADGQTPNEIWLAGASGMGQNPYDKATQPREYKLWYAGRRNYDLRMMAKIKP